ncbi:AmmeMemoRadiSam system protein A [Eubacterium sp.]|uniref:AmmeMemoRadiSam system protein A n=1 Tax=Eubacterium sp. TaxID=142586 RepID=UPI002FC68EA7
MYLKGIAMASHPPIIIPEVGDGREQKAEKTIRGMKDLALEVAKIKPKTIVCITPHGNVFRDGVSVLYHPTLSGDFGEFGAPQVQLTKACDMGLLDQLNQSFGENNCHSLFINPKTAKEYDIDLRLDHGVLVPLTFIDKVYPDYKILHLTIGYLSLVELYRTGRILREAIELNGEDTLILASADLSHCLKDEGPYAFDPRGPLFDTLVVKAIEDKAYYDLLTLDPKIYEPAGQCGLRPIVMALGAADSIKTHSQVFAYEGPFGVGYMEALITFDLTGEDPTNESLLTHFEQEMDTQYRERLAKADPFVSLATQTIDTWVRTGTRLAEGDFLKRVEDEKAAQRLADPAGVFITIYKSGELRGCIGTIHPVTKSLSEEIIRNAIEAATYDPRFLPVEEAELNQLSVSVSIMGEPETIDDIAQLDPHRYGVIAEKGLRRGLLLPNLTGIDTIEEQIAAVKRKAGIPDYEADDELGEKLHLQRFEVEYYH